MCSCAVGWKNIGLANNRQALPSTLYHIDSLLFFALPSLLLSVIFRLLMVLGHLFLNEMQKQGLHSILTFLIHVHVLYDSNWIFAFFVINWHFYLLLELLSSLCNIEYLFLEGGKLKTAILFLTSWLNHTDIFKQRIHCALNSPFNTCTYNI